MNEARLKAAESHFREHGDKVQFNSGGNPNASYDVVRGDLTVYAYGRLKDWMDAEDAVQEAYLRVLAAEAEPQNFGGIYKIVLDHTMSDMQRHDKVVAATVTEDREVGDEDCMVSIIDLAEGMEVDPQRAMEIQERVDFIMESSNQMSRKAKGIVRMNLIFGYTPREIEKLLHIPNKRVRNTLDYFRKKLEEFDEGSD